MAFDAALSGPLDSHMHNKLEAAMILRGVVTLVLEDGSVEVQPRTWYREGGTQYLEARKRPSGERMVVRLDQIRDVRAY
jgi:transcriptional antiterminator Rof (Rho-off)